MDFRGITKGDDSMSRSSQLNRQLMRSRRWRFDAAQLVEVSQHPRRSGVVRRWQPIFVDSVEKHIFTVQMPARIFIVPPISGYYGVIREESKLVLQQYFRFVCRVCK